MSLDTIPALLWYGRIFPAISERDIQSLGCVNKHFNMLIAHMAYLHLGIQSKPVPIENEILHVLRVLATHAPEPKSPTELRSLIKTKETFEACVIALGVIQPQNAVQLRNQYRCIWHLNYSIPQEVRTPVQSLEDAVANTSVEIGKFSILNGEEKKDYKVSAVATLTKSMNFKFYGNTRIHIHPASEPLPVDRIVQRKLHSLSMINTTRQTDDSRTNEYYLDYNKKMDLSQQWFEVELEFRDVVRSSQGSNRELDQKIVQIMVEILQQNDSKSHLQVDSNHADYPVLVMGGFNEIYRDTTRRDNMINEVMEFRAGQGNNLFPPYRDYSGIKLTFNREALNQKNVRLSWEQGLVHESWSEIIARQPILHHQGGFIPDYWTTKPIEEEPEIKLDLN